MTTTSWTTAAQVPPGPWAALVADTARLLRLLADGGARVFGPATSAPPLLSDEVIHFTVVAPPGRPLTVLFERAAGSGQVATNAPHTDALVLVAVQRAKAQWGALIDWTSDAGAAARAAALDLIEHLYAGDDRAVSGAPAPSSATRFMDIINRTIGQLVYGSPELAGAPTGSQLDAVIARLAEERAGLTIAARILGIPDAPPIELPPPGDPDRPQPSAEPPADTPAPEEPLP